MKSTLIYIHGQYGSPEEAEHYRALLPGCEVIGFDYKAQTPWEAEREFAEYFDALEKRGCGRIGIIASLATISDFARSICATLEVMPGGEHWFHTPEQMAFLDRWTTARHL